MLRKIVNKNYTLKLLALTFLFLVMLTPIAQVGIQENIAITNEDLITQSNPDIVVLQVGADENVQLAVDTFAVFSELSDMKGMSVKNIIVNSISDLKTQLRFYSNTEYIIFGHGLIEGLIVNNDVLLWDDLQLFVETHRIRTYVMACHSGFGESDYYIGWPDELDAEAAAGFAYLLFLDNTDSEEYRTIEMLSYVKQNKRDHPLWGGATKNPGEVVYSVHCANDKQAKAVVIFTRSTVVGYDIMNAAFWVTQIPAIIATLAASPTTCILTLLSEWVTIQNLLDTLDAVTFGPIIILQWGPLNYGSYEFCQDKYGFTPSKAGTCTMWGCNYQVHIVNFYDDSNGDDEEKKDSDGKADLVMTAGEFAMNWMVRNDAGTTPIPPELTMSLSFLLGLGQIMREFIINNALSALQIEQLAADTAFILQRLSESQTYSASESTFMLASGGIMLVSVLAAPYIVPTIGSVGILREGNMVGTI